MHSDADRRRRFESEALPHADALFRTALRFAPSRSDAEDLVQETFLKAYRAFDRFEPGTNCRAWLFKILTNTGINQHHARARRPPSVDFDAIEAIVAAPDDRAVPEPAQGDWTIYASALDDEMRAALAALPEPFRVVLVLSVLEGFAYKEIAAILDVPIGTVMSRLFRARRIMQAALSASGHRRGGGARMSDDLQCSHVAALLAAHAEGELDAAERHAVDAHLAACVDCRALRAHELAFTALLRDRLQAAEAAPASLHAAVRRALDPPSRPAWWARALASPWAPRWAAAVVLALVVAVPLAWLPHRGAAQAQVAVDQHRSHTFVPGEPLPPCCTAVAAGVGTRLGPPSPGAQVPSLAAAGLELSLVVHCTFTSKPVHLASYAGGDGRAYTLTITDRTRRQFKLTRARTRDGVTQAEARIESATGAFDVTRWLHGGLVYTWVRPAGDARGEAALALLLAAAR